MKLLPFIRTLPLAAIFFGVAIRAMEIPEEVSRPITTNLPSVPDKQVTLQTITNNSSRDLEQEIGTACRC